MRGVLTAVVFGFAVFVVMAYTATTSSPLSLLPVWDESSEMPATATAEATAGPTPTPEHWLREHLACTGSMEPTYGCTDDVSVQTNFRPSEIVRGAVIDFLSPVDPGYVLHRVLDVKVEDGAYYYWTGGDANLDPDGWWIQASDVRGYVIAHHKNTRPWNAAIRARVREAQTLSRKAELEYLKAWEVWEQLGVRYCGSAESNRLQHCHEYSAHFEEFDQAYQRYEALFDNYITAYDHFIEQIPKAGIGAEHE